MVEALNPPSERPDVGQPTKVRLTQWTKDRLRCTLSSLGPGGKDHVLGRLVVNRRGQNKSFWVPFQVLNMFGPILELAPRPVRVGARWPLHVHLVQQRLPLTVKSSHRANQVTLVSFDAKTGEATLEYLLSEEVVGPKTPFEDQGSGLATHMVGRGVFSTRKGTWSWLELRLVVAQGGRSQEAVLRVMPLAK
ncbi:MAG: hypothetical protein JKY65_15150 [Planctomycetes bacterium]|nr:hypothetical protein [Planctomycetota bacterium]